MLPITLVNKFELFFCIGGLTMVLGHIGVADFKNAVGFFLARHVFPLFRETGIPDFTLGYITFAPNKIENITFI